MEIASNIFFYRGRSVETIKRGAGSSNVTIVRGDGLLMIDTGVYVGGAFSELLLNVQQDKLNLSDLLWIVHTHCHWDHINATKKLLAMSRAKIAAGEADVPLIVNKPNNFESLTSGFKEFEKEIDPHPPVSRFLLWFFFGKQPQLQIDRPLIDSDEINIGKKIIALSLPGHTTGHTGYFVPDTGTLALGDLIDFENAQGMDLNNSLSNYESALESVEKALRLEPEIIIPGHGEPTIGQNNVKIELEKALSSGIKYPKQIKKALGANSLALKQLTFKVFPDTPGYMESLNMMLVLTVLIYMEKQGTVKKMPNRQGKLVWSRVD